MTTRKAVLEALAGQYHSVFKGRGMAFSEVRPYQPGDEIRVIDWNVTARMNDAYVKVFTEERELTVMLAVDVSASKDFGTTERTKAELAAEVAAQLAFSAIANNDRVGLVLFSDRIEKVVAPKKGRKHVMRVVTEILTCQPQSRGTDLSLGLAYVTHLSRKRAVTFLISDFIAKDYETELRLAAKRHDLVPVVITDPAELDFPDVGLIDVQDAEGQGRALFDTSDKRVRAAFVRAARARAEERRKLFRKLDLDAIELLGGDDHGAALTRFFHARARRLAA
ncbi:MAG: DUF58 domain-containing protein [Myxococcaceae bacterium]